MVWTLYSYAGNPRALKVLITARYNDVEIECAQDFKLGIDNKKQDFLRLNPHGTVPTLQTGQGGIWQSNAIVRFVARSGNKIMYGHSEFEAAHVDAWMDWAETALEPACSQITSPLLGFLSYNKKKEQESLEKIQKELSVLDRFLTHHTFLVRERISAADIVVLCTLLRLYTMYFDPSLRKPFRAVDRWFLTLLHQPEFLAVLGTVHLCEQKMELKKLESSSSSSKRERAKPAKPARKQQESEAEPTTTEKDEGEAEEEANEKPKAKNPLDLLPKSKFVLDEWKRFYSNNDSRTTVMPWFWENYDPEGHCMYFAEYKFASENKMLFMTCNYVSGLYQRLDDLRKYGMGSTLILGTETEQQVQSCWVFRGNEIPPMVTQCDDYELWTWSKIDTNDTASRERVNDFFCWDRPIDGKAILEGKIYK